MTAAPTKQTFDHVTDEALAELRAEIGTEIKGPPGHITEATRDGIRHFAMGIGDENPLWLDDLGKGFQTLVTHRDDANVRLNGAKRVVSRFGPGTGDGIEDGRFADVR